MTTQEYCAALEQALSPMPPEERQETIRYYLEFLEDANESERAALGTPTELAQRILRENGLSAAAPFPENPPKQKKTHRNLCGAGLYLLSLAAAAAHLVYPAADRLDLYCGDSPFSGLRRRPAAVCGHCNPVPGCSAGTLFCRLRHFYPGTVRSAGTSPVESLPGSGTVYSLFHKKTVARTV